MIANKEEMGEQNKRMVWNENVKCKTEYTFNSLELMWLQKFVQFT